MIRFIFAAMVARLVGQPLLYSIRFIADAKHARARTIKEFDNLADVLSMFNVLKHNPEARKEKAHGIYYIAIETRSEGIDHQWRPAIVKNDQADIESEIERAHREFPHPIHAGVPGSSSDRSDAADSSEAAHPDQEGDRGDRDDAGQPDRSETAGGDRIPLSELGRR